MANRELQTINSVLENKDISVLFGQSVDDLFVAYGEVWADIKKYYARHHAIPSIEVMQEKYDDLEHVQVKGATQYYLDALRAEHIDNRIESIMLKASAAKREGMAPEKVLETLQNSLNKLQRFSGSSKDMDIMDFDLAEKHYEEVRERAEQMGGTPGIPTGVSFIDSAYTTGLSGGDLVVVLGWTGRAKSLFTTLVSCNAHDKGHRPMIVSLEMPGEKLRDRVLTIKGSGIFQNSSLALGDINMDDFRSFKTKHEDAPPFHVITNDGIQELNPNAIQAKIDQYKPSMLTFDYAQLGTDNENSNDMTARMRNMSKQYKRLAVANDIPVILISSATADSSASADEPPTVEQVAWSKQLAFDADLAFAVHRHDDSNLVQIVCRKNRNGPLFAGFLDWDIDRGIIKEAFL